MSDQLLQAICQYIGRDSFVGFEKFLVGPGPAHHHVADDQQRPAIAQHLHRSIQWTSRPAPGFALLQHISTVAYIHLLFTSKMCPVSRAREGDEGMSKVRVLAGTRKGAFILTSDGKREKWDVSGPHFAGWEIYHLKGSPADPNRLYASQCSGWFGQIIQRSDDGGKTWHQPGTPPGEETGPDGMPKGEGNKFV